MLKPHGYVTIVGDTTTERDSITCAHCNQVVLVKPGTASTVYLVVNPANPLGPMLEEPGAGCRMCAAAICLRCERDGRCTPIMRRIEQMEARNRFLQSVLP